MKRFIPLLLVGLLHGILSAQTTPKILSGSQIKDGTIPLASLSSASLFGAGSKLATVTGTPGDGCASFSSSALTSTGSPCSPVTSIFGRTGAVVAATNDYSFAQISGTVTFAQIAAAAIYGTGGTKLASVTGSPAAGCAQFDSAGLLTSIGSACGSGGGSVSSVFGRTGAVVAAANDYSFNQLAGTVTFSQISVGALYGVGTRVQTVTGNPVSAPAVFSATGELTSATNFVRTATADVGSVVTCDANGNCTFGIDNTRIPRFAYGSAVPATCVVGETYYLTSVTPAQLKFCYAPNTFGDAAGLPTLTANQLVGQNAANSALEAKSIVAGSNVTVTHTANTITIAATGGGGGGCAPTETTFCTYEEFDSDVNDGVTNSTVGVQYPYQRGRMIFALLAKSTINFAYGSNAPTGTQTAPGWLYLQDAGPGTNVFGGVAWGGNRGGNNYSTRVESLYNKTLTLRVIPNSYAGNTAIYGIWSASTPLNPSSGTWGDPAGTAFCPVGIAGFFIAVNSGNGSSAHVCDGSGTNYRAALTAWQGASVPMTYTIAIGASPLSTSTLTFTSTPAGGSTTTATIASGTASRPSTTTYSQYVFMAGGLTAFSTWIDYIMYSGTR